MLVLLLFVEDSYWAVKDWNLMQNFLNFFWTGNYKAGIKIVNEVYVAGIIFLSWYLVPATILLWRYSDNDRTSPLLHFKHVH